MATTMTHTMYVPDAGCKVYFQLAHITYSKGALTTFDQEYPWCDRLVVSTDVILITSAALAYHVATGGRYDVMGMIKQCPSKNPVIEQAMVKLRLIHGAPQLVCSTYREAWADFLSITHRADMSTMWINGDFHAQYSSHCSLPLETRPYNEERVYHSVIQRMMISAQEVEKGE